MSALIHRDELLLVERLSIDCLAEMKETNRFLFANNCVDEPTIELSRARIEQESSRIELS